MTITFIFLELSNYSFVLFLFIYVHLLKRTSLEGVTISCCENSISILPLVDLILKLTIGSFARVNASRLYAGVWHPVWCALLSPLLSNSTSVCLRPSDRAHTHTHTHVGTDARAHTHRLAPSDPGGKERRALLFIASNFSLCFYLYLSVSSYPPMRGFYDCYHCYCHCCPELRKTSLRTRREHVK